MHEQDVRTLLSYASTAMQLAVRNNAILETLLVDLLASRVESSGRDIETERKRLEETLRRRHTRAFQVMVDAFKDHDIDIAREATEDISLDDLLSGLDDVE